MHALKTKENLLKGALPGPCIPRLRDRLVTVAKIQLHPPLSVPGSAIRPGTFAPSHD